MNRGQVQFSFPMTPTVKWLMIITVGIWLLGQVILERYAGIPISRYMALYPAKVLYDFSVWQIFTYMFLHTYDVFHILMNMLMLWFLGAELEGRWGRRFFLSYYIGTGAGAALIYVIGTALYVFFKHQNEAVDLGPLLVPVMGASGAGFGLLLAYGMIFGERLIYVFGVFPLKAKFFAMIFGAIAFASLLTSNVSGGDVAHLAHVGGLVSGYLILISQRKLQQFQWNQKAKKKSRNLRLVVDNEKSSKTGADGPKYWN